MSKPLPTQTSFVFDKPAPNKIGPPCLNCGHKDTVQSPGVGPHAARLDCPKCGFWRWSPKRPPRGQGGGAS